MKNPKKPAVILVVDDTIANLRVLVAMLDGQGYRTRPVDSGALALRAARSSPPDLILLDIMMPEMDGFEVCRRLKADEKTRNIPVIFISALDATGDKVRGFAAGGVDYVTKPFQTAEVLARIRTHLDLWDLRQRLQEKNQQLRSTSAKLRIANEQLAYILKHFVPPQVAEKLIEARGLPRLGGEQKCTASLLFADVRNFTGFAEVLEAEHVLEILNAYLTVIAQAIQRHRGTLIDFAGDQIMAAFNVPEDQPNHPLHAARAALDICDNLKSFAVQNRGRGIPELRFGIGLHTGKVISGYLGTKERYQYSVLGDTSNVAAHFCSQAQGGQIIISQKVLDALGERAIIQPVQTAPLKGRHKTFRTYELTGLRKLK